MRTTSYRRRYTSRVKPQPTGGSDMPASEPSSTKITYNTGGSKMNKRTKESLRSRVRKHFKDANITPEGVAEFLDVQGVPELVRLGAKIAREVSKNDVGSGFSLAKKASGSSSVVENTTAIGSVSNSSMVYVCNKHRSGEDKGNVIPGYQESNRSGILKSPLNLQSVFTMDILSSVPVRNDQPITDLDAYTRSACVRAWEKHVDSILFYPDDTTNTYRMPNQQISLHWKSVSSELKLTNNNNNPVVVKIYDLVSKFSCGNTDYINQYLSGGYMDPTWAWKAGLDGNNVLEVGGDSQVTRLGTKPNMSTTFNRVWKITGETKINLTGGASHTHRSVYSLNKTQSYQEFDSNTQFSGLTDWYTNGLVQPWKEADWQPTRMVVIYGMPSGENQATSASVSWSEYFRSDYICRTGTGKTIDTMA